MKQTTIFVSTVLALFAASLCAGAEGRGGQPAAFRDLEIGGRPSAMGGAFTALAEGSAGQLYNPAGLAQLYSYGAGFSYRAMKLDRRLGYVSGAVPAKENAVLSFSWLYAGSPDLESRDEQGNIIDGENISYSENLIGITFAKRFIPELLLGGRVFYVQNNIATISAYTVGVDIGGLVKLDMRKTFLKKTFPLLQAGLAIDNLGANYRWSTGKYWMARGREQGATVDETFPANFRTGIAFMRPGLYTIASDLEINAAGMVKTHVGGEYTYARLLSLRAGLDQGHPTFGIGIFKKLPAFALWVDFSYLMNKVGEGDDLLISFDAAF